MTRTPFELSVVCEERFAPADAKCEDDWMAIALDGPIPFETTGVLAALTAPLSRAGISVFAVSTYDTDLLLVPSDHAPRAEAVLREDGFEFQSRLGAGARGP